MAVALSAIALLLPAQAHALFGPEARIPVVTPAGQTPAFTDFAVDPDGFVYVLWPGLVQKYSPAGSLVQTWGSFGTGPGQFQPTGDAYRSTTSIAVDDLGHVFVSDAPGNRVVEFTTDGAFVANLGAFTGPSDVAVDSANRLVVASLSHLTRLAQDGTVLASQTGYFYQPTPGPGDRVYNYGGTAPRENIGWADGPDLAATGSFPMLVGDFPDYKGNSQSSCCGLAFLQGRLWVARSMIHDIEAYGPDGGFAVACPAPDYVFGLVAGRDGRLYLSDGKNIVRYNREPLPCDSTPPDAPSVSLTRRLVDISSYRTLRSAWAYIGANKQSEATLTLTRRVTGRRVRGRCVRAKRRYRHRPACLRARVKEATYRGIPVTITDGGNVRFADLLWHDRPPLGRYELSVVVTDRNGLVSQPTVVRLRLSR